MREQIGNILKETRFNQRNARHFLVLQILILVTHMHAFPEKIRTLTGIYYIFMIKNNSVTLLEIYLNRLLNPSQKQYIQIDLYTS